jgi:hypothetical protein
MDSLADPSECRAQALHCRLVADTATDEQVRGLWLSMAQIWIRFAEAMERLQPSRREEMMKPQDERPPT